MAAPAAPPQEWVPGYDGPDNPSGPFLLELNPGPEPSRDRLSGYVPDPAAFRAWYETEMCGLHALNVDNARQVAVLCPGSKPIALAEWEDVGSDVDAHTMASSLMSYFSTMFKPAPRRAPAAAAETAGDPRRRATGEDKNALGARLYPLIELSQPELAGKLTGMFLEMSEADLVRLLESPALLDAKVAEAVATLEAHGITRANAASPPASPGAPPDPPPSKRAMIRRLMSESRVKCTLAFDHWQVRDAVSHLCYLAGPRSDDGRGDRWLVRKLPKRGNGQDAGRTKRRGARAGPAGVKAAKPEYGFLLFGNAVARDAVLELGNVRVDGRTLHRAAYHHEPPPPPVDPPSPAYSDEPPSPGVANGHDYTVEAAEPHGRAADDGPRLRVVRAPADDELLKLLESPVALDDKVAEAVANLDNGEASSAGSTAPTPDAPQTNGSTEKRRKPGGKGPDGRGDRWMLRRPPGEALPATADEFVKRAESKSRARGVSAQLQVWLGGIAAVGTKRILPFLAKELCALEALKAVDDRTAKATFEPAGSGVARQAQHLLFTAESRLLAFEVLGGSRLRGALRADGASAPRPRDPEYGSSASRVASRDAVLSPAASASTATASTCGPCSTPGTVPASVPARKLSGRADLADPARVALANARASRERAPGDRQPGSPRKLPYTYVIAEPDSPVVPLPTMPRHSPRRGRPGRVLRRRRGVGGGRASAAARAARSPAAVAPLPAPIIITAGGTAASAQESTILQQLANFGDVLREERRRHDEDRARVVATMSLQLDGLRAQVRAAAQPDVKSIVAALKGAGRGGERHADRPRSSSRRSPRSSPRVAR
ncbi:polyadenylate-binding protein [Aureococcus anophagefferens]|nr:polyadenylate-binding protein [Aureococcus anophagefferens]